MTNKPTPVNAKKFACEKCAFECSKLCDYNRHLVTAKHKRLTNANNISAIQQPETYKCICGNEYKHAPSLCKHKKTCTYNSTPQLENTIIYTQEQPTHPSPEPASDKLFVLVKDLMLQLAIKDKQHEELMSHMVTKDKQLAELQNTMKEMIPHLGNNNNTNINSNNNTTFNVQLYLENECKDALSIQEFVKRIEINMDHLRTIAKDGYVDSVSNILIKALNNMEITERPLHCTDLKRETVYIKNNETWNKSTADEPLMNGLINTIENKHYAVVKHYVQTTPAARELDTPEYNFYAKACVHALGNYEDHDKLNKKIYKKVLPEIKLDKSVIQ
jgi:hypothetical protein